MNEAHPHYRLFLGRELERRMQDNPLYSLRAFARDLGPSPSRLSEIMNGKAGLSSQRALELARKLGLGGQEARLFVLSAESLHARTEKQRVAARLQLVKELQESTRPLAVDAFQVVSDWHHFALLELIGLPGMSASTAKMARALGISEFEVREALQRLERLEMVVRKENGGFEATDTYTPGPDGIPSEAVKKFHRQVLEKAIRALGTQSLEKRDFSALVLSIDGNTFQQIKKETKDFRRKIGAMADAAPKESKDAVYCLSIQLFELANNEKGDTP